MFKKNYEQKLWKIPAFATLPDWQFDNIVKAGSTLDARKGQKVLERGSDDGFTYLILDGALELAAASGPKITVEPGSNSATLPVAQLRPRFYDVVARTKVQLFRVPDLVIHGIEFDGKHAKSIGREEHKQREAAARISFQFYQDLQKDAIALPSLPDMALRVRRAIRDESSNAKSIARLVETDPAITAKIIKSANSAFYGGMRKIDSVSDAVVRMGMNTTTQLVTSFAMKEIFRPQSALVAKQMKALWQHSTHVAAICFVIAREYRCVDPEQALLLGLVHDIGKIPLLSYADQDEQLRDDAELLEAVVQRLRGELSALTLRQWSFNPEMVNAARQAEDWLRRREGPADLTDLLIVAQVHENLVRKRADVMPETSKITALQRVLGEKKNHNTSLQLILSAADKIEEMHSVLRS